MTANYIDGPLSMYICILQIFKKKPTSLDNLKTVKYNEKFVQYFIDGIYNMIINNAEKLSMNWSTVSCF